MMKERKYICRSKGAMRSPASALIWVVYTVNLLIARKSHFGFLFAFEEAAIQSFPLMWSLYFSVQSSEGQQFSHSFNSAQLEHHMDVLSDFIVNGFELVDAFMLHDGGGCTDLPLEAFDGTPIGAQMRTLEMQYRQILSP